MTFRARLFLALLLAVLLPLGALAVGVRRELGTRLAAEYRQRVDGLMQATRDDLQRQSAALAARLGALGEALSRDNRFRLAAVQRDASARRYLLDYAGSAMRLTGLSMLQLQDSAGRILSSGHFRNAYDQSQPDLPRLLATIGGPALVRTRTADAPLLAIARVDSVRVAGQTFTLVGGVAADTHWLATRAPAAADVVGQVTLPYLDLLRDGEVRVDSARYFVTQSLGTLRAIRRRTDLWFAGAVAATALFAVLAAAWLSRRVSRPLSELASRTAAVDLDRLDVDFATDRPDEIGALSRLLDTMVGRLRRSSARLREAERRMAVGDVARQVNHDVKNGLAPIRHVLRHLSEVARDDPSGLAAVFEERKGTLESSVAYLENLARNYARLTPPLTARACDVNAVVRQAIAAGAGAGGRTDIRAVLADDLPPARGDDVALRRILENLIGNALDSLDGRGGTVTVSTERAGDGAKPAVRIVVADTGRGMTRAELDRAFDDFFTTKDAGTGLGLSIVRRLVLDLGGALRVETEPGAGTRVLIELPGEEP